MKIKVYQLPLTQEDFEGEAELLSAVFTGSYYEGHKMYRCKVRFPDGVFERTIMETNKNTNTINLVVE